MDYEKFTNETWASFLETFSQEKYGMESVNIASKLPYFDSRTTVPVSLFIHQENYDKALKLLSDKKLLTAINDGKEFTIDRYFNVDVNNTELMSVISLLNQEMDSYTGQDILLIIDHALSAWFHVLECSNRCTNILERFTQFCIYIANTLVFDLELEIAIEFTGKTYVKYLEIYGPHAEVTLHMKVMHGISYRLLEDYSKSLNLLKEVLAEDNESIMKHNQIYLTTLYGIINVLFHKSFSSANFIQLIEKTIIKSVEYLGENNAIALRITLYKIMNLHRDNKPDLALDLIDSTLRIVRKVDPNLRTFIALDYLLVKAVIHFQTNEIIDSYSLLGIVKLKIQYWNRYSGLIATYTLIASEILLKLNKFNESIMMLKHVIKLAPKYVSRNSPVMQRLITALNKVQNKTESRMSKRNINSYQIPEQNLTEITRNLIGFRGFKSDCLIKGKELIDDINQQSTASSVTRSTYEVANSLVLLDVLLKKVTGNKNMRNIDEKKSSESDLNAAVLNICDNLELILQQTLDNVDDLDNVEMQSILRDALTYCSNGPQVSKVIRDFIRLNLHLVHDTHLKDALELIDKFIINNCKN